MHDLLLPLGNNLLYFWWIVCFCVIVNIAPSKRRQRSAIIIKIKVIRLMKTVIKAIIATAIIAT
ncbi:hypothetical protein UA42_21895, partial [Photobacterium kishitanii]